MPELFACLVKLPMLHHVLCNLGAFQGTVK